MISGDFLELGLWGGLGSRSASFGLLVGRGGFWHGWDHLMHPRNTPNDARDPHVRPEARVTAQLLYVSPSRATGPTPKNLQIRTYSLKIFLYSYVF